MLKIINKIKYLSYIPLLLLTDALFSGAAIATQQRPEDGYTLTRVTGQVTKSAAGLPAAAASICLLLALLFSCLGVLKLRARRNDPDNVSLSQAILMFALAAAFFILDLVFWTTSREIQSITTHDLAATVPEATPNATRPISTY